MGTDTPAELLLAGLSELPNGPLCVAYSGGVDSSLLLHCLAASRDSHQRALRAIHVDHQLHVDSALWANHCRQQALAVAVPLQVQSVDARPRAGQSPEDAARQARYQAFSTLLRPGEILITAHHQDDQAETLLLRMLRGAGTRGLGSMSVLRELAPGWLWRPWLTLPVSSIRSHAEALGLSWLDDPSNQSMYFDRNRLRHQIIPALRERWPDASRQLARCAEHLRGMQRIVAQRVELELARLQGLDPATLDHHGWRVLANELQALVLGHWLESQGQRLPPPRALAQLMSWDGARSDGEHTLRWPQGCLKLWRGWLHAVPEAHREALGPWTLDWHQGTELTLPHALGCLQLLGDNALQARDTLGTVQVGNRRGGERIRLQTNGPHRPLRLLFQEAGIAPWLRSMPPLLTQNGELAAIGNLWRSARFQQWLDANGLTLRWQQVPQPG